MVLLYLRLVTQGTVPVGGAVTPPGDHDGMEPWIPVDGRDAGPEYPSWINPAWRA